MSETKDSDILELIKTKTSVKKVADQLDISRQSLYNYIEKYEQNEYDKIPAKVLTYFEQLSSDEEMDADEVRFSIIKELSVLKTKLAFETENMEQILQKRVELEKTLAQKEKLREEHYGDPEIAKDVYETRLMLELVSKESIACSESVKTIESTIDQKERILAEFEQGEHVSKTTKDVFKIKSSYYIENGKCMVIHNGKETGTASGDWEFCDEERLYYRLHLYSKIGSEFILLGKYKPVKDRNFFIIDDALFTAPLYYNIVTYIAVPEFNSWDKLKEGEEPPLTELSGADCTGICELKQRK